MRTRYALNVSGIVQGVGFRPFVYALAKSLRLDGWVFNNDQGVSIEIEGEQAECNQFCRRLVAEAPMLAKVSNISRSLLTPIGEQGFSIRASESGKLKFKVLTASVVPAQTTLVSPDMGICEDCLRELRDPHDRRYRYAFINCTNCGPRFTIIEALPYDRAMTTMKSFPMCGECNKEYHAPDNRRFHAQPNACRVCGPSLSYYDNHYHLQEGEAIMLAQKALLDGQVIAVKGLGGYHLVCNASDDAAVRLLRRRKYRYDKPFALMMPDLQRVSQYCDYNDQESQLLSSQRRPIVLLRKKQAADQLSPQIAPGNSRLGVMLPYTPLHYLLMEIFDALVMTSGNYSDEPIVYKDNDAFAILGKIANGFLIHNREIFRRCDDSVAYFAAGKNRLQRRSRGWAPEPLEISAVPKHILAVGGEQKNTFCLVRDSQAFLSQHIGDLDNIVTLESFEHEIEYFKQMFGINPQLIVHDLHPEYLSTKYVQKQLLQQPLLGVQHHHAHLAAVIEEHKISGETIGLIFDGTGYGEDGCLWGGEVLVGDCRSYRRFAHLAYAPLPGGEAAIKQPWRMALSYIAAACGENKLDRYQHLFGEDYRLLWRSAIKGINAPFSSGMGRLFDGVAALCADKLTVNYEGQAAVELELAIDDNIEGAYSFEVEQKGETYLIGWKQLIREALKDAKTAGKTTVATRFHRAVIDLCLEVCRLIRQQSGINQVALSGGVWQNIYLLEQATAKLEADGFKVYSGEQLPANDGCISYGQAAVAIAKMKNSI